MATATISEAARTVSPNERGLVYALPTQCAGNYNCTDWSGIGAFIGQFSYQHMYNAMESATLKLPHGRLQHFAAYDDWTEALFPYAQLVQYDASEVAAGRPSLFVSATYQGVARPVIWNMYGLGGMYATYPARAVNLKDERFIQFWVNQYIRPWLQKINKPNTVILLDNGTFYYSLYGVKDNAGNFISGVKWDYPYAQNQTEFLTSINNFILRVRQIDPSIKMIFNTDAASTPSEFQLAYGSTDGVAIENMEYYYQGGDSWWRSTFYTQYLNIQSIGNAGKIGLMGWMNIPNDTNLANTLRRAYMHYLMVRGDNFFFAPQFSYSTEVPPSAYATMKTSLGLPTAPTLVTQEPGRSQGYVLYSRETSGGIAYLNWTGAAKTITLPAGRQYKSSNGQTVTQITIPDMAGDYVLFSGSTAANASPSVTLTAPANGATVPPTFTITASATDADGSIARVEFWQGSNKLGERTAAPYSWTVYGAPAGVYSGAYALRAKAIDNSGAVATSSAVDFTVSSGSNVPPTVTLTGPSNGTTVPSTFTITATASDADGSIARVEFWQGPNKLGERYSAPYTWTIFGAPPGVYSGQWGLTVKAVDNTGAVTTSSTVDVIVSSGANTPPTVTLTSPANGAVVPPVFTITANAFDSDGSIVRVEFWQGPNKLGERTAAPYTWTIYGAPPGDYSGPWALTVKAVDNSGNTTTSTPTAVTVK